MKSMVWCVIALLVGLGVGYSVPRKGQSVVGTPTDPTTREWHPQSKTVAYVLPNEGPYYDLKWAGVSEVLKARGYEPVRYNAAGYKNIKVQTDIIENVVQKGVAGIILHPVSDTAVVPFVESAFDRGIPVIAENVDIRSQRVAGRVMLANAQNGWELAMALALSIHGEGKIAALVGPPGQEQAADMWKAAREYLARFPRIEIVREEYLQANTPEALERAQGILLAHSDLAGFYTWYVQNAIGVAEAVRQAGLPADRIKVVTKDTNPQAEQLLRDGYLHYLLVGEPITMGQTSARLLDDILQGRPGDRFITLRNRLVDKHSLAAIDRIGFEVSATSGGGTK